MICLPSSDKTKVLWRNWNTPCVYNFRDWSGRMRKTLERHQLLLHTRTVFFFLPSELWGRWGSGEKKGQFSNWFLVSKRSQTVSFSSPFRDGNENKSLGEYNGTLTIFLLGCSKMHYFYVCENKTEDDAVLFFGGPTSNYFFLKKTPYCFAKISVFCAVFSLRVG